MTKVNKTVKVIDRKGVESNVNFYNSFNKILYKTPTVDNILDVDIMHLYKFYEPFMQCKFSSCLGQNLYVTKRGTVHFCPLKLDDSLVGTLKDTGKYFDSHNFATVLKNAIAKRNDCKASCKYFDYCMGACPMQDGCCDFPQLFDKNSAYIDDVISNQKDLSNQNHMVARIVVKDMAYGE